MSSPGMKLLDQANADVAASLDAPAAPPASPSEPAAEPAQQQTTAVQAPPADSVPEKYEVTLPADLKLPDGVVFSADYESPLYKEFSTYARNSGMSQARFNEFVGVYARNLLDQHLAEQKRPTRQNPQPSRMPAGQPLSGRALLDQANTRSR